MCISVPLKKAQKTHEQLSIDKQVLICKREMGLLQFRTVRNEDGNSTGRNNLKQKNKTKQRRCPEKRKSTEKKQKIKYDRNDWHHYTQKKCEKDLYGFTAVY